MKFITNFLKFKRELKRLCQLNSWRPFLLVEAISFSGKRFFKLKLYSFSRKTFLLVETISHFFQWRLFLLVEAIFLVEAIPFNESRFNQRRSFHLVKVVSIGGSRSFQSKLILLVEGISFGVNISCSENIVCN